MLIDSISQFIIAHQLLQPESTIIIGLSGGPDSVFLLHLFKQLQKKYGIKIIAAHFDHQWRTNSADDAIFCKNLCTQLNIHFVTKTASELGWSPKYNGSAEEMGRLMRRYFFEQVKKERSATNIALAHHAQDQQETFFIRLIRGATLSGLTSMKPHDGSYIRPLLQTNKKDILSFLHENTIAYITDPTNASDSFLRNRIRNYVAPALQQADQRFDQKFLDTLQSLRETEDFLIDVTQKTFYTIAQKHDSWHINVPLFFSYHRYLQHRMLIYWFMQEKVPIHMTQSWLDEIMRYLEHGQQAQHQVHKHWILQKKDNYAYIIKI